MKIVNKKWKSSKSSTVMWMKDKRKTSNMMNRLVKISQDQSQKVDPISVDAKVLIIRDIRKQVIRLIFIKIIEKKLLRDPHIIEMDNLLKLLMICKNERALKKTKFRRVKLLVQFKRTLIIKIFLY